jgi:hypothetical protein
MKMKKHILFAVASALVMALALAGCEKPVAFNGEGPSPKLVISAICGPNAGFEDRYDSWAPTFEANTHFIGVEEAVFLFGGAKPGPVVDPQMKVSLNGADIPVETTEYISGERVYHHFNTLLAAGDRLEFSAETARHGRVSASDVMPAAAVVSGLKAEWFADPSGDSYLRTLVTVDDPAGESNYYRFAIRSTARFRQTYTDYVEDADGRHVPVTVTREVEETEEHEVYTDHEILFNRIDNFPSSESWKQVSDEMFDGRSYTFDLYINLSREPYLGYQSEFLGQSVTVDVHTLSAAAFRHLRSKDVYDDSDNLSEPVRIYSNVEGGYGIFGLYNVASRTVDLPLDE